MASRPWQWVVFFFTRPIRFADVSALASRIGARLRRPPATVPAAPVVPAAAAPVAPPSASPAPIELPRAARLAKAREPAARRAPARDAAAPSMFHPELGIGVSEQPIDTLPAELRDELKRPAGGRLQGSLHDR